MHMCCLSVFCHIHMTERLSYVYLNGEYVTWWKVLLKSLKKKVCNVFYCQSI